MPATLHAVIDHTDKTPPNKRNLADYHEFHRAKDAMWDELRRVGLVVPPGAGSTPTSEVLRRFEDAAWRYVHGWESRAMRVERQLRALLASDVITPEQREDICNAMYGGGANNATLSDVERQMVNRYRRMDADGRAMLRTLFERLAQTSEKGGA